MPSDDDIPPSVDYHETDEGFDLMAAVGFIILDWNWAEHQMSVLIWHYVGDMKKGGAITANLGNVSRATILTALAHLGERDEAVLDRVNFAAELFDRLREGRNAIAHSMRVDPDEEGVVWTRVSKSEPIKFSRTRINPDELWRFREDVVRLCELLRDLHIYVAYGRGPLPQRFPLPSKLTSLPPLTPMRDPPQQPPSGA